MHESRQPTISRVDDLCQDSGTSRTFRFLHDVFNMGFYRRFGDAKGGGNFFVRPALGKVFHDTLLAPS